MFESYLCPDVACTCDKKLKEGQNCPDCNTPATKFGMSEGIDHLKLKKEFQKSGGKILLVTPTMGDDEIQKAIYQDMNNLASHEAGTKWLRVGAMLSLNTTEQLLSSGFKMLVDQNKIIIRQNELILRNLKNIDKK